MDITPLLTQGITRLTGYGKGGFTVNGEFVEGSILLLPTRVQPWQTQSIDTLDPSHLAPILECDVKDLLWLIGSGHTMIPLADSMRALLRSQQIRFECMDTGAACRTYSILTGEGRRVAAALIALF